ncbi:MAG TPA: hypothetical protein VK070_14285 [Acidimicrobiia bacterium]|nr:hypothetical protein [Acidimicrobiia bacterium]
MLERLRRRRPVPQEIQSEPPVLSFGSWAGLDAGSVVQVCHPRWRGVRTVTYAFGDPVIECSDMAGWTDALIRRLSEAGVRVVVIQGWPPGSGDFARAARSAGLNVKCVLHSSPAQHGADPVEALVADEVLDLARTGVLSAVGMVKAGVAEAFASLGHPVIHLPNRAPIVGDLRRQELGPGLQVGVFAEPFWRKNVTTQLLAVGLLDEASAHVMTRPSNRYLDGMRIIEHGELPYDEFLSLQASVDLNLYVTLSECHPSTPQESYLAGVPCLMSRTSSVFRSDEDLWELTTVDEADNPQAIAQAARHLLEEKDEAIRRARDWIFYNDQIAAEAWEAFTAS